MNNILRKNTIKTLLLFSISATSTFSAFAEDSQNTFQSTATIENTCLLSAENVNFGQVFSPLTSQGAQSQMSIQCSNSAPYTVDLAYGGVYGSGAVNPSATSGVTYELVEGYETRAIVFYKENGSVMGTKDYLKSSLSCDNGGVNYPMLTVNVEVAKFLGIPNIKETTQMRDKIGACTSDGKLNIDFLNTKASPKFTSYAYGIMNGSLLGDALAYKITIPGDLTKVWNVGNNSYKATGIGTEQIIAMNAQIVPGNSSSLFPAQDMYSDIVTIIVSY